MGKKLTSKMLTQEHKDKVHSLIGYKDSEPFVSDYGYAFYYNQMVNNKLDLCDADRYANLNTILGYDVGIRKFRSLDNWLWGNVSFDLMELNGSEKDKALLQKATKETNTKELDYSKWRNMEKKEYTYSYFEKGIEYK